MSNRESAAEQIVTIELHDDGRSFPFGCACADESKHHSWVPLIEHERLLREAQEQIEYWKGGLTTQLAMKQEELGIERRSHERTMGEVVTLEAENKAMRDALRDLTRYDFRLAFEVLERNSRGFNHEAFVAFCDKADEWREALAARPRPASEEGK